MLTIVLRNEGFEPRVCATGDQALAAFREFRPDLVALAERVRLHEHTGAPLEEALPRFIDEL
jgi:DNA-binding response OmpR family regulator